MIFRKQLLFCPPLSIAMTVACVWLLLSFHMSAVAADCTETGVPEIDAIPCGTIIPTILLSGQSNMVGNPHDARVDWDEYWAIFQNETVRLNAQNLEAALTDLTQQAAEAAAASTQTLATGLLDLYERHPSLFHSSNTTSALETSMESLLYCSFTEASVTTTLDDPQPVSPTAGCGDPFGLELLLAHMLELEYYNDTSTSNNTLAHLALPKVAVGDTNLVRHWSKDSGTYWSVLQKQIQQPDQAHPACTAGRAYCVWTAFVWFQGENDAFTLSTSESYLEDLTEFVGAVRTELSATGRTFVANHDSNKIPIILVKLGAWLDDLPFGDPVRQAQVDYLATDEYAWAVESGDLSAYFHFDVPSMWILGDRVAQVLMNDILPGLANFSGAFDDGNNDDACTGLFCRLFPCF